MSNECQIPKLDLKSKTLVVEQVQVTLLDSINGRLVMPNLFGHLI
jgi:hypothetical protein